MGQTSVLDIKGYNDKGKYAVQDDAAMSLAAEDVVEYNGIAQLDKLIISTKKAMEKSAKDLDFMEAARLRDKMLALQKEKDGMR